MPVISSLGLTITPATALYMNPISDADISASVSTREGRTAIVLDFNDGDGLYARDLGTTFTWLGATNTVLDIWQPSLIDLPENIYDRASDWMDGGTPGAKYIQGYSIEADSFNAGKTLGLQSGDDQSLHTLLEIPGGGVPFNKQTRKFFSCTPFVAHTVRRVSDDGVPWRVWSEDILFQPYPELQLLWETEMLGLGGMGWQHLREMNLSYISTAAITLVIRVDPGGIAPQAITVPSSSGLQAKVKIEPTYNKWKLVGFAASSSAVFRLWLGDLELKIRSWGDNGPYRLVRPFGGKSAPAAEV